MNDREKFIVRAALIYLQSNRDDVNDAFHRRWDSLGRQALSVNGDEGELIKEDEVADLLMTLQ